MGLVKDMKERKDFTERECDIRDFFLENPESVISMSSREVGDATYSSAAAVTRFCQKMGCKGFPDFKLRFISCLQNDKESDEYTSEKTKLIQKENTLTVLKKVSEAQIKSIEKTRNEIIVSQIARVASMLEKAQYIDFYVYDNNVYIAEYACSQFFHCGKNAHVYSASNLQELNALSCDKTHIPIIISHTGSNGRLIEIASTLKKKGHKTILITRSKKCMLSQLCDETIVAVSTDEYRVDFDEMWTIKFITSVKYVLDVLFGMVFSSEYDKSIKLNEEYEKVGEKSFWDLKSKR